MSRVWQHTFHRNGGFWGRKREKLPGAPQGAKTTIPSLFYLVVVQSLSCGRLWDPRGYTPGFPVLHYLPESAQTHVHWSRNVIQPSHPLSPPSPLALNLSQNQGLFQRVGSSHQVAKKELCENRARFPLNKLTQSRGWRLRQLFWWQIKFQKAQ